MMGNDDGHSIRGLLHNLPVHIYNVCGQHQILWWVGGTCFVGREFIFYLHTFFFFSSSPSKESYGVSGNDWMWMLDVPVNGWILIMEPVTTGLCVRLFILYIYKSIICEIKRQN